LTQDLQIFQEVNKFFKKILTSTKAILNAIQ